MRFRLLVLIISVVLLIWLAPAVWASEGHVDLLSEPATTAHPTETKGAPAESHAMPAGTENEEHRTSAPKTDEHQTPAPITEKDLSWNPEHPTGYVLNRPDVRPGYTIALLITVAAIGSFGLAIVKLGGE